MKALRQHRMKTGPLAIAGSDGARKAAAVILEVLSGLRGTAEACEALSITPMRYYVLETRALQGLVASLEPRPRGKKRSAEDEVREVRREKQRLERELMRTRALVRVAERTIGIPAAGAKSKIAADGKKKLRRRPERAGRAIAALRAPAATSEVQAKGGVSSS
ncbi:MAG: hypothetical protein ACRD1P_09095 [Thermoanaerobaculia bacterium]